MLDHRQTDRRKGVVPTEDDISLLKRWKTRENQARNGVTLLSGANETSQQVTSFQHL